MSDKKLIGAGILFFIIVSCLGYYLYDKYNPFTYYDDEVHVHSDFLIIVNDKELDLTDSKYQSSTKQILHKNVHLHDGEDHVVHRHAEEITFAEFLSSLGITMTEKCLSVDTAEMYCSSEEEALVLFVNQEPVSNPLSYINQEEDQILIYFGRPDNLNLETYLGRITDESCIYSGTCPERGTAPPESCGLTCEI
jgi:hypothetical protein